MIPTRTRLEEDTAMELRTAPGAYAQALLLVADVAQEASRTLGGRRFEEQLKAPLVETLLDDAYGWAEADDLQHLNLIAGKALTETVDFVVRRHALAVPVSGGPLPTELWPDLPDRLRLLGEALEYAASVAEDTWRAPLGALLAQWFRDRLPALVGPVGEREQVGALEARLRHAVVLCHRYRQTVHQVFGDRMWTGRLPARWWCPDQDLAVRAPFHDFDRPEHPVHLVRLRHGDARRGDGVLAVQVSAALPVTTHGFTVADGEVRLDPPAPHAAPAEDLVAVVVDALRALDTALPR